MLNLPQKPKLFFHSFVLVFPSTDADGCANVRNRESIGLKMDRRAIIFRERSKNVMRPAQTCNAKTHSSANRTGTNANGPGTDREQNGTDREQTVTDTAFLHGSYALDTGPEREYADFTVRNLGGRQ